MINLKSIYTTLLMSYILTSLLIPLAMVNKVIFIVLILIYGIYVFFIKEKKKFNFLKITLAPVIIITIFCYGFVRGMMNGSNIVLARQFLLASSMFVLIYPIEEFEIDFNELLKRIAPIYIIFFMIYVVYAVNIAEYRLPLFIHRVVELLDNKITAIIGKTIFELGEGRASYRALFGTSGVKISIGSIPFLLVVTNVLFIDFLDNRKRINLIWVILSVLMSWLTASRALMLLLPISICLVLWLHMKLKWKIIITCIVGIGGSIIFLWLLKNSVFFSFAEGSSNFIKWNHITSYTNNLTLKDVVLGQGIATYYYSTGTNCTMAHTEITLLDHCRWFGIIGALIIWGSMLVPRIAKQSIDKIKDELTVFLIYLLFSQTNPVLFNSFGLITVLWYWDCCLRKRKKEYVV